MGKVFQGVEALKQEQSQCVLGTVERPARSKHSYVKRRVVGDEFRKVGRGYFMKKVDNGLGSQLYPTKELK